MYQLKVKNNTGTIFKKEDENVCLRYRVIDKEKTIFIDAIHYEIFPELKSLIDLAVVLNFRFLKEGYFFLYMGECSLDAFHFHKSKEGYILKPENIRIKRFVKIGDGETGPLNKISDVDGVTAGNFSVNKDDYHTGVTVVKPSMENVFRNKMVAASYVYNGFGKSIGLMQIDEMGSLETNIALTSTLNVGKIADAMVEDALSRNPEIAVKTGTVNPVVMECNDGALNKSRDRVLNENAYSDALSSCKKDFREGDVGAGAGMMCFGMKGGIGSSSRKITLDGKDYMMGILLNSNFGSSDCFDFKFCGRPIGKDIKDENSAPERGSVVAVVATDLPLSCRQLRRILKRVEIGIGRTGSYAGSGSGDVFLGFSTANRISHFNKCAIDDIKRVSDDFLDICFKRAAEMTEEAVLNSLLFSGHLRGYLKEVSSLAEYGPLFIDLLAPEVEYV